MTTRRDRKWWKERWVADHYAVLKSPALLRAHIEHRGESIAVFAEQVAYARIHITGDKDKGCSRQMISALVHADTQTRKRRVKSCEPDLAAAVERVLNLPPHMLFDVLPKSRDKRELANGQAA